MLVLCPWGVGGGVLANDLCATNVLLPRVAFTRVRGSGMDPSEPGVVFVLTSSVKCKSLSYCNGRCMGAPGVSRLTRANAQFGRYCTKDNVDSPSEYTLLANGGAKGAHVQSGVYATKNVTKVGVGPGNSSAVIEETGLLPRSAAVTAMLDTTNCQAYLMGG